MAKVQNLGVIPNKHGINIDTVRITFDVCKDDYVFFLEKLSDISATDGNECDFSAMSYLLEHLLPENTAGYGALAKKEDLEGILSGFVGANTLPILMNYLHIDNLQNAAKNAK